MPRLMPSSWVRWVFPSTSDGGGADCRRRGSLLPTTRPPAVPVFIFFSHLEFFPNFLLFHSPSSKLLALRPNWTPFNFFTLSRVILASHPQFASINRLPTLISNIERRRQLGISPVIVNIPGQRLIASKMDHRTNNTDDSQHPRTAPSDFIDPQLINMPASTPAMAPGRSGLGHLPPQHAQPGQNLQALSVSVPPTGQMLDQQFDPNFGYTGMTDNASPWLNTSRLAHSINKQCFTRPAAPRNTVLTP
ncbi:hypothetical protein B0T20DRAFT_105818 [Sordaria brevicollis]|uniref:Uncharacterized protein n=1 Tax=Sordaria brevicollis TaxID=83679 RepID=A0AAE0NVI7_SORBR|nr:hypothetical protein B0T20DRAFT_105818 [Sordaria brevicollis]